jgi:hypothetical protein
MFESVSIPSLALGVAGAGAVYFATLCATRGVPAAWAWLKSKIAAGGAEISKLRSEFAQLAQGAVADAKSAVSAVQSDVASLKTDVALLKAKVFAPAPVLSAASEPVASTPAAAPAPAAH